MCENTTTFNSETDFRQWLSHYDPSDQSPDILTQRFISGVHSLGINVYRSSMWLPTSHPELWGIQVIWTREQGAEIFYRDHDITSTPIYLNTPGEAVHKSRQAIRWKLDVAIEELPYPLLHDVKNEGGTDYLIVPFHTDHASEQPWITFATQKKGGFSDAEINTLKDLCIPLSWKARVSMAEAATQSLLSVYLGSNAARRVMNGQFKRGTGEHIHAVIWYCDLRDFTVLGGERTAEELVHILDNFFECIATPIENAGGEILKFIGDAVLAIFPLNDDKNSSCDHVLDAAEQALSSLQAWSSEDVKPKRPQLEAGIALHIGDMVYGNIGGSSRLDFTVIGAAVNEAARIEGLCKTTFPLLTSESFAQNISPTRLKSIGKKKLRGVSKAHDIFTLSSFI
ncbi:MAG: adenylate/guanylate cyclase domain-containing protein [Mariprofundaceae bacterium]|nr:adenylate/guanylate cyclase domain-containing protein [Mariprofundaceae bacterium]